MTLSKQIVWTLDEKAAASMQSKIDKSQGCNRFLWHHFRSDLDNTRDVMIHVAKVLPEMSEFAYFGISFDVFQLMHTIRKEEGVDATHFPLHWSVMSLVAHTLRPNKEESSRCEACEDGNKMAYGESPSGVEDIQHHWPLVDARKQKAK